jgi:7-cyano-7-deazaguanine synthase
MLTALLLSGGVDSSCLAYLKRPNIAYTVNYGQMSATAEIDAARRVCRDLQIEHIVLNADVRDLGCGPLAGRAASGLTANAEWWPFRNQFLVTVAAMHAVQHSVHELWVGSVKTDSRHADGRSEFVELLSSVLQAQEGAIRLRAPAISLSSKTLVTRAGISNRALLATHSCHQGNVHCCQCPGCTKRLKLFRALSITDMATRRSGPRGHVVTRNRGHAHDGLS